MEQSLSSSTPVQKKYTTVQTKQQVKELLQHIHDSDVIAFDTETDSLNPRTGNIIGWSVSGCVGEGFYLPTLVYDKHTDSLQEQFIEGTSTHELSTKILPQLLKKKIVAHNFSFDGQFTENYYGIDLTPALWADTILMVHTVNEEGAFGYGTPFGLKSIAIMDQKELGLDVETSANEEQLKLKASIKANGGSTSKLNYEIFKADLDILAEYGAADTDLTLRVYYLYLDRLKEEGLEKFFFEEEVMPIYREVTIPMEAYGIDVDVALLQEASEMIKEDLKKNKKIVMDSLLKLKEVQNWVIDSSLKAFPPSNKGRWAQKLIAKLKLPLPINEKSGKCRITKKEVDKLESGPGKKFLLTGELDHLEPNQILRISTTLWKEANGGEFVNIQSKQHLRDIVFNYIGETTELKTVSGADKFDDDTIEALSSKYEWANNLRIYNRLVKIKSTYIDRFLEGHENGRYYFYFKQYGTVSGRYGSDAQQLPKPKEEGEDHPTVVHYTNLVRAFLIAGKDRKIIDADYQSLEPRVFGAVTEDEGLQEIFRKGWDFYSTIAIKAEKLEEDVKAFPNGVSADMSAPNYLKKLDVVRRNKAKVYSLGLAYGMSPYALSKNLDIPQKEAEEIFNGYLDGFPGLKKWREDSREFVKANGYIKNKIGRVRHLPKVKKIFDAFGENILDWKFRKELSARYGQDKVMKAYRDYRNGMNNTLNFQIQSLAASIVNRAALQINRRAKELGVDAIVQAQIHDQLVINVREDQAEMFAKEVQHLMETTTTLAGVDLIAPPEIANNLRDGH